MKKTAALLLSFCLCLCGASSFAAEKIVTTSFYPVYIFALNLLDGVEDAEVHNMAAPGTGCLHDYQLTSGDMKQLAKSDCLLICGAGMESYLSVVCDAFPSLPVFSASEGIELMQEDSSSISVGESETLWNSHVWLDPKNAVVMVKNMAEGLKQVMPGDSEKIDENCRNYIIRIEEADREIAEDLENISSRSIITFHEAFPYFAKAYGLTVAAVVNREPGDALSPKQMGELVETVEALGNPPLFTEPQYDDMAAQTLSRETGASVWQLDPVVTGPEVPPLTYYETVMRENGKILAEALK